jgi:hypothetical protein
MGALVCILLFAAVCYAGFCAVQVNVRGRPLPKLAAKIVKAVRG